MTTTKGTTPVGRTATGRPPMGRTPAGSTYSRSKQSNAGDSYMCEGGDGDAEEVDESLGKEISRGSIASKKSEIGFKSKKSEDLAAKSIMSKMSIHLSAVGKQKST